MSEPASPPRTRPAAPSIARWITLSAVLIVIGAALVGGYVGYRFFAIRSYVAAAEQGDSELVSEWGLRLARFGWLDAGVREALGKPSAGSFGFLGDSAEYRREVLPVLARLLDGEETPVVRRWAAEALWIHSHYTDLAAVVPALAHFGEHEPDVETRAVLLRTYGKVQPNRPAPAFLNESLKSPSPTVRLGAVSALLSMEPRRTEEGVAILFRMIESTDQRAAQEALDLLPPRGWDVRARRPVLLKLTSDSSPGVRAHAAVKLSELASPVDWSGGPLPSPPLDAADVVGPLRRLLFDRQQSVRSSAILALELMGPRARAAVPDLRLLLTDVDHFRDAAKALATIDREAAIAAGVDPTEFGVD